MNLDDVLRDPSTKASLVDHEWYDEGMLKPGEPTFDPSGHNKNNNTKDDLEVEWGHGTIDPFYAEKDGVVGVPSGVVDRNVPIEEMGDASPVIVFARDMMNRGMMGPDLARELKVRFDQPSLKKASGELRELLRMEGIVGCLVVDARGYDDPRAAVAACRDSSPYHRFVKYIMADDRPAEDYVWLPRKGGKVQVEASSCGNAVDDFFSSMDKADTPDLVAHCKQTMLPILAHGDLDGSEMDSTLIDVMNVVEMPSGYRDKMSDAVSNGKYSASQAIQSIIVAADRARRSAVDRKYEGKVDSSGFVIDSADAPMEFAAEALEDIQVDNRKATDVQVDVGAPMDMLAGMEFDIDEVPSLEGIDLFAGDEFDVDMDYQAGEKIFADCDHIELGDVSGPDLLDIDMNQDLSW
jgi:hypothetical protein